LRKMRNPKEIKKMKGEELKWEETKFILNLEKRLKEEELIENYDLCAILRDEINNIKNESKNTGS
jgi:protein-arginine kinase activator protein McsA